jgi:flagellar biosynthesis/type III secretory pathway ATPase
LNRVRVAVAGLLLNTGGGSLDEAVRGAISIISISYSGTMPVAGEIKKAMAIYRDAEDLINIGAYVKGSNEKIDYAIRVIDSITSFLEQDIYESYTFEEILDLLSKVLKEA